MERFASRSIWKILVARAEPLPKVRSFYSLTRAPIGFAAQLQRKIDHCKQMEQLLAGAGREQGNEHES